MSRYNREDLDRDLHLMVKAGLLEIHIREDGQWTFSVSEDARTLTEDQIRERLERLDEHEDE